MVKVKKAKIAIEDILLPIDEHPYEIPQNWCWVKHNSVLDISGGSQPAKSYFISEPTEGYIKLYQTRDYGDNPVPVYIPEKYATKTTVEGDILLARYGGSLGKVFRAHEGAYNVALAKIIKLYPDLIDDEYLYKYYFTQFYQDFCVKASKGRSAQAGFNRDDMNNIPFPLPPLAEQRRIVEQIESLFSKLDEAKEKALSVVESFELREKAIYKKAFEGDLTNSWRAENGINISEWEEIPFEKLGKLERGRSKHRPRNDKRLFGGKYPFIQTGDVAGAGMYVTSHKQTLSEFGFEQSRMFPKGTLCITIAANIGDAAILSYDCCFPDSVVGFTPGEKCLNKYMYFYLQEIKAELEYIAPATAQKNLNLKLLGKVEIKVPSLKEQEKIVEILEKQINDQENIVEKAENVIETIDVMKKSILAKAFRGELGTNIETEESAIELLKSIF